MQFLAIEGRDRALSSGVAFHGDKGEAARAASHPVGHQRDLLDCALFLKKILKIVFRSLEGEITYI